MQKYCIISVIPLVYLLFNHISVLYTRHWHCRIIGKLSLHKLMTWSQELNRPLLHIHAYDVNTSPDTVCSRTLFTHNFHVFSMNPIHHWSTDRLFPNECLLQGVVLHRIFNSCIQHEVTCTKAAQNVGTIITAPKLHPAVFWVRLLLTHLGTYNSTCILS